MSKIKYFMQQSWLLIVASFCFGLLLATTNAALSERIKQNEKDKLYGLMGALITEAADFAPVAKEGKTAIYKAIDEQGNTNGFAFIAVGSGFADKIKLVIAVDKNFEKFYGFKVLSSNETPGFGSKIVDSFFNNQFKGIPVAVLQLSKTGDADLIDSQIITITGATVSSDAVVEIFNSQIEKIKSQLQQKGLI